MYHRSYSSDPLKNPLDSFYLQSKWTKIHSTKKIQKKFPLNELKLITVGRGKHNKKGMCINENGRLPLYRFYFQEIIETPKVFMTSLNVTFVVQVL